MCFLVQTTSHWNTRSTIDRPWQSCVFFFKWHHIEIPVLLTTDLDNHVFSCLNDITLKYPFYYRPTMTIVCFLVQTTSHWNTRSTINLPWQSCVFLFRRHYTEIPVLLTTYLDNRVFSDPDNRVFLFKWHHTEIPVLLRTDLDNCAFSCSDDITLKYPFYYRPTFEILEDGWQAFRPESEKNRYKELMEDWRVSHANRDYKVGDRFSLN